MADEENVEESAAAAPAPEKKKSKTGLYLAIIIVQLIIAGFLVWQYVLPEYNQLTEANEAALGPKDEKKSSKDKNEEEDGEPKELGIMYKFENLTVNPSGTRGMRYGVFEFSLEVHSEEDILMLDQYKPVLIDNYISFLRKQKIKDLSNEAFVDSIKTSIIDLSNEVLGTELVSNIYFTRFMLQ